MSPQLFDPVHCSDHLLGTLHSGKYFGAIFGDFFAHCALVLWQQFNLGGGCLVLEFLFVGDCFLDSFLSIAIYFLSLSKSILFLSFRFFTFFLFFQQLQKGAFPPQIILPASRSSG